MGCLGTEQKATILDEYDCFIMPDRIRIGIASPRDPSLTDVISELYESDGFIYFDGSYYDYDDRYSIDEDDNGWYLDLFIK